MDRFDGYVVYCDDVSCFFLIDTDDCYILMTAKNQTNTERIVSRDPEVLSGALVFAGTRVPVKTLIDYLKSGETLDRFLDGFPTVEREQAEAYLEMTLKDAQDHA